MENFVLYEELGKGEHSVIYKGRRKGTINFVAIHCIGKCKRAEVTNTVRMTHDISNDNVVKFYEWYETSNHLWLVVELCTGGSLQTLITQDGNLPESCVRTFGIHLVNGLHYIHSLGILFHDLRPSKILLDSTGVLKYADFGLSKVEGENLHELFLKFSDAGEQWNSETFEEDIKKLNVTGSTLYMAPEVIEGTEPTVLSDLWAMGCVFYEMFTGHPPFLADTDEQLKEKILNKDFPPPRVKGTRFSGIASPDFLSLLEGLLHKDHLTRLGWPGLVNHPFWHGELSTLAKEFTVSQEIADSVAEETSRSSVFDHRGGSSLGRIKGLDPHKSIASNLDQFDATNRPGSTLGDYMRPKTAPGSDGGGSLFTLRDSEDEMRLLFVSDPQIVGYQDEPVFPIGAITRYDSDSFLRRTFGLAFSYAAPDVVIFLGDMMDEGSKATSDEYEIYMDRLESIFYPAIDTPKIFVAGDNDIGGEGKDYRTTFKVSRFEHHFENLTGLERIGFIDFLKFDPLAEQQEVKNLKQQFTAPLRVVINHETMLPKMKAYIYPLLMEVQPHLLLSGHWHQARHYLCKDCLSDNSDSAHWPVHQRDLSDIADYISIELNQPLAVNELMVPTCSYRMGEDNMGYGMAVINSEGHLQYTVLWLPSRYIQLYVYIGVFAFIALLCVIVWVTQPVRRRAEIYHPSHR